MLESFTVLSSIVELMTTRADDKPSLLRQPPFRSRNTLGRPNSLSGKTRAREKVYQTPPSNEITHLREQLLHSNSASYQSDHPSFLGNSSSLFSANSPPSPLQFGVGRGTQSSPFTFSLPPTQTLSLFQNSVGELKQSDPIQRTPESTPAIPSPLKFGAGKGTSSSPFTFELSSPSSMVVEREPPKPVAQPSASSFSFKGAEPPIFGKPSQLNSMLQPNNHVFNIPKHNQSRPEHHRTAPTSIPHLEQANGFVHKNFAPTCSHQASHPRLESGKVGDVPISRPTNAPLFNSYPKPAPTFSAVNAAAPPFSASGGYNFQIPVDLTKPQHPYSADPALHEDRFGTADPYLYIDPDKANENIKALLEGALEDEEDKPRTRSRRKKVEGVVNNLADKMTQLGVKTEAEKQGVESENDDVDDGSVEGLKVKLLPHQIEGTDWMLEKETGAKKKISVLPKGGILADDMGGLVPSTLKDASG